MSNATSNAACAMSKDEFAPLLTKPDLIAAKVN